MRECQLIKRRFITIYCKAVLTPAPMILPPVPLLVNGPHFNALVRSTGLSASTHVLDVAQFERQGNKAGSMGAPPGEAQIGRYHTSHPEIDSQTVELVNAWGTIPPH